MTDDLDGLYQRAQRRDTSLMDKLADLTEDEWDELTHRLKKHFTRVMAAKGFVIHKENEACPAAVIPEGIPVSVREAFKVLIDTDPDVLRDVLQLRPDLAMRVRAVISQELERRAGS